MPKGTRKSKSFYIDTNILWRELLLIRNLTPPLNCGMKMKNKKEIRICSDCGTPLIWAFRWDYNERYCLNCQNLGDMFMGKDVELTNDLKVKDFIVQGIWKSLYGKGYLLPASGRYKKNKCKKCDKGEYHGQHLTEKEIEGNKISEAVLEKLHKIFN